MKDIVLVSAYCDTDDKIRMLHDLLFFLKSKNKKIILCTHLACDAYLQNYCDYYIFDKENERITDKKYFGFVYLFTGGMSVHTKNAITNNNALAVLKSMFSGINLAKFYDFDIVHYIEYDTKLNDISEIEENNKILSENNTVNSICYVEGHHTFGNYIAMNLNKISLPKFKFDKQTILNNLLNCGGLCEDLLRNELLEGKSFVKDASLIRNQSFDSQLVKSGYLKWGIVIAINEEYHLCLFNPNDEGEIAFDIIEDSYSENKTLYPKNYYFRKLNSSTRFVKIFGNNLLFQNYDLQNESHIQEIKNNSHINFN